MRRNYQKDKNTRERSSFGIYEQKKSYRRALGYGIQIFRSKPLTNFLEAS